MDLSIPKEKKKERERRGKEGPKIRSWKSVLAWCLSRVRMRIERKRKIFPTEFHGFFFVSPDRSRCDLRWEKLAAGLHVWFCATSSFINKAQLKRMGSQGDGVAWPGDPDFLWLASFTISPHQVLRQRHVSETERERGWVGKGWDQIVSEWVRVHILPPSNLRFR